MKPVPLTPLVWPDCPAGFDRNGLALVLLPLSAGTQRADARRLARSVLPGLLAGVLGQPATHPVLVDGPRGPVLEGAASDIRISLSYAGDRVLIGLVRGRALGVDIVSLNFFPEVDALARLYFPRALCRAVLEAPPELQSERFARAWAQIEACCKCLALPLAEIDEQREQLYAMCELPDCGEIDGYRIAVAVAWQ